MARTRNGTPTAARRARSMHASARRVKLDDRKASQAAAAKRQAWQDEAWDYFDDVPEIKYSTWFLGNAIAKLRIFAAVENPDDPEGEPIPVTDPSSGIEASIAARANAELARLKSPIGGRAEILRELNMNLEIAAECYLVGLGPREIPSDIAGEPPTVVAEQWDIKSVSEVKAQDGKYTVTAEPNDKNGMVLDENLDTIIRIWQRHPRWSNRADCQMRGVLSECEALLLLSNQVKGEAKSHQSAGLLLIPNDVSLGADDEPGNPEEGDDAPEDTFYEELEKAILDPIDDPSSPASAFPLILRGEKESLKEIRQVVLARTTTSVLEERITARVQRIARGLNLPVEVVLGHQGTTFANAGQVDEDTYEDHLEPRCMLLVDALTIGFLQPQLLDAQVDPDVVERIMVWFDPSAIIGKTDPKDSADKGAELDLISGEAWRRVKGFGEDDAPTPVEMLVRAAIKLRALDPTVSAAMLKLLGVPLDIEPLPTAAPTAVPAPDQSVAAAVAQLLASSRPARDPGRRLAAMDRELRARVITAADRSLTRILERAGNRLKARAGPTKAVLKTIHPLHAAAHAGPALVAQAGLSDDDLVDDNWDELHRQFMAWGGQSQADALGIAADLTGLGTAERDALAVKQAANLDEAWSWMHEALVGLAHTRLYAPDPHAPDLGEFDPTSRVPTGLVRQAIARAGGASGIENLGQDIYVAVSNGRPLGGIGTGELIMGTLSDHQVGVEAYEWDYGSAFRAHPFEEHEALDGQVFGNFDDSSLGHSESASWLPSTSYFPGDHDGCACDIIPIIVTPD